MAEREVTRRLTTIVAADVAGYSRLMGADEEGTLAVLRAHRYELIDPKIAEHGGRIANTAGDSILVEFPSVVEALRCAMDIQSAMSERNRETPEDRRIEFRIGMNVGDVMDQEGDLLGDGVNVAARLEGLAEPGGICISRTARDQVRDRMEIALEDLGEVEVKNIARPVRCFRVLLDETRPAKRAPRYRKPMPRQWVMAATVFVLACIAILAWFQPWKTTRDILSSPLTAQASIAVLPFVNLSQDLEQEYFSDGITNDLITDLSKFHDLFVIASNSVFTYKGKPVKVQIVGRELGVRYVLEGSVQKIGDRVRINAQLIDAGTGRHLWADRYEESLTDLFDLQDRITRHIVRTLAVKLSDIELDRAFAKPTDDLGAYDYVLRGQKLLRHLDRSDSFAARKLFRQAIQLDPTYANAYAGLGWTYLNAFLYGWTGSAGRAIERAEELARQALTIDPSSIGGRRLLARVYVNRHRNDLALVELERVIALNPNNAQSYAEQGIALIWSSHPDGAIQALNTALRFDPKMNAEGLAHLGLAYYVKKRYEDAAAILERSVGQDSDYQFGYQLLTATYGQLDRRQAASRAASAVRRLDPFFEVDAFGGNFRDPEHAAHLRDGLRKAGL